MKLKTRQNQKLKSYLKSHRGRQATAPSPSTYTSYVINFEEATFKKIMREGLQAYEEMVRLNQEMWEMLIKEFTPHLQVVEVQLSQGFSKIANSPEMQEAMRLYDAIRQKPVYEDPPKYVSEGFIYTDFKPHISKKYVTPVELSYLKPKPITITGKILQPSYEDMATDISPDMKYKQVLPPEEENDKYYS